MTIGGRRDRVGVAVTKLPLETRSRQSCHASGDGEEWSNMRLG